MKTGPSPKGLLMKRKILSASAKVFLEKGYAKASSKMVAELLGVSNGSPFFHYGNKEGVLLELVAVFFVLLEELFWKSSQLSLSNSLEAAVWRL